MESQADYRLTPPVEVTPPPALLSAVELEAIQLFRSAYLAGMRRHEHALDAYTRHIPQLVAHAAALTARAEKAEARVKEQQAELSEQERDKLALLLELGSR